MRVLVGCLVGLLVLLGGCLSLPTSSVVDCDPLEVSVFAPTDEQDRLVAGENEPVPVLVWANNTGTSQVSVTFTVEGEQVRGVLPGGADASARVEVTQVVERGQHAFEAFEVVPGDEVRVHVSGSSSSTVSSLVERACWSSGFQQAFPVESASVQERVQAGEGAVVNTVGVWENGTSFYTNLERFHERGDLPRGYADEEVDVDPLNVYVYEEDSDEMPQRYEQEGFVTTIPGFNENLKGHPLVGATITHLAPEEAYTREGYEDHELYGDALVFYVEVEEAREVPCSIPEPICSVPDPPETPAGPTSVT